MIGDNYKVEKYNGFILKRWQSNFLWWAVPIMLFLTGLLYENRELWYQTYAILFATIFTGLFTTTSIWEFLSYRLAYPTYERIQANKKELPLYW